MKRFEMTALDSALQREARQIRQKNGFSLVLHQRLMQALRAGGLPAETPETHRRHWSYRIGIPLGLAAAVALGAWLIVRTPEPAIVPKQQMVYDTVPNIPANPIVVAPKTTALEERKYAYLDRDAQRLLMFVADQLPDLPQQK